MHETRRPAVQWWRGFSWFDGRTDLNRSESASRRVVHTQPPRRCTTQCRCKRLGVPRNAVATGPSATFGFDPRWSNEPGHRQRGGSAGGQPPLLANRGNLSTPPPRDLLEGSVLNRSAGHDRPPNQLPRYASTASTRRLSSSDCWRPSRWKMDAVCLATARSEMTS